MTKILFLFSNFWKQLWCQMDLDLKFCFHQLLVVRPQATNPTSLCFSFFINKMETISIHHID